AGAPGQLDNLLDRHDGAQRVGNLGYGDDARAVVEQLLVLVEQYLAGVIDGNHAQMRAAGPGQLLPGHDVGVVFEVGDDDFVALAHVLRAPAFCDQVDG